MIYYIRSVGTCRSWAFPGYDPERWLLEGTDGEADGAGLGGAAVEIRQIKIRAGKNKCDVAALAAKK